MPGRNSLKINQGYGGPWFSLERLVAIAPETVRPSAVGRSRLFTHTDSVPCVPRWLRVPFSTCLAVLPLVVTAAPGLNRGVDLKTGPLEVLSERGRYVIEYTTDPNPIRRNEMFEMQVMVREPLKKAPAKHVTLEVDAGMPGHGHGMNTLPVVKGSSTAGFRVYGMLFHMAGDWEITFTVRRGVMSDRGIAQVNVK